MTFHIITLFPNAFKSYLGESILKRAIDPGNFRRRRNPAKQDIHRVEEPKIAVKFYNPRDFVYPERSREAKFGRNIRIDKRPYGGGPGMVIQAEPVIRAIEKAYSLIRANKRIRKNKIGKQSNVSIATPRIIWLTPSGKQFTNEYAGKAAKKFTDIIIICGRYEGIDARVRKIFKTEDISVGPFVLTGGELPAMIMIDAISRQIPGILGNLDSVEERRIASPDVYTRPEIFKHRGKSYRVPKILLSGHKARIEEWKQKRTNT